MNKLLTCMLLLSFLLSGCQNAVENPAIAPSDPPLSSAGEPAETENSTEESLQRLHSPTSLSLRL